MSHVLVVCAANICRSPSAAVLLRRSLEEHGWVGTVSSAGVTAVGGRSACDLAMALVGEYARGEYRFRGEPAPAGGPIGGQPAPVLAGHRSRLLTAEMAAEADLILVMEEWHLEAVNALGTGARVRMLDEEPIADPHAVGYQAHALVFAQLRAAVAARAREIAAG